MSICINRDERKIQLLTFGSGSKYHISDNICFVINIKYYWLLYDNCGFSAHQV